jgi:hypothetical protein
MEGLKGGDLLGRYGYADMQHCECPGMSLSNAATRRAVAHARELTSASCLGRVTGTLPGNTAQSTKDVTVYGLGMVSVWSRRANSGGVALPSMHQESGGPSDGGLPLELL